MIFTAEYDRETSTNFIFPVATTYRENEALTEKKHHRKILEDHFSKLIANSRALAKKIKYNLIKTPKL